MVGLVEVPLGIPLGDIVYDIGGGIPNGKEYKAAQRGDLRAGVEGDRLAGAQR